MAGSGPESNTSWFSSFTCSGKSLETNGTGFYRPDVLPVIQATVLKALKRSQTVDPSYRQSSTSLILPWLTTRLWAQLPSCQLSDASNWSEVKPPICMYLGFCLLERFMHDTNCCFDIAGWVKESHPCPWKSYSNTKATSLWGNLAQSGKELRLVIDQVKVLHATRHKIGHFRDAVPS